MSDLKSREQSAQDKRDVAKDDGYLFRPMSTWTDAEWKEFHAYEDAARKDASLWDKMRGQ